MSSADYAKNKQAGARRRQFKPTIEAADARKKREENADSLRKSKRLESFAKRRNIDEDQTQVPAEQVTSQPSSVESLVHEMRSENPTKQYDAISRLRKLLAAKVDPPIQATIAAGAVPLIVSFLSRYDQPHLQLESAWSITNICSGNKEQTQTVISAGALPALRDLVNKATSEDVIDQAVWALGNIAGDSPTCRDQVIATLVLDSILNKCFDMNVKITTMRHATWTLSNFCRGKPQPAWDILAPAVPILCKLIHHTDVGVLADALWALAYVTDGPVERMQAVLQLGICRRVVDLLLHHNPDVQTPALRFVGNLVTGDDKITQEVLDCNVVPQLKTLLLHSKKQIRKEACWAISNITAGNRFQIQQVIEERIFPRLMAFMKSADYDVRKESAWALSNATASATPEQIDYLVGEGIIEPMCEQLSLVDTRMVLVGLDALEHILKAGATNIRGNPYTARIESCGGLDKIEQLQNHHNMTIYEKAVAILETHFQAEEDQNVAPNNATNTYQFGFTVKASSFDF